MAQKILCITAGQRSGTTALRSLISADQRFKDLGEIFDTSILDQPQSFFGYCHKRRLQLADIMSGPDAERLCKDYVALLQNVATKSHLLIDVKFNSWGEIRMPWTYMHQEPFFLSQLKWMSARFIFIWRQDLVGQVLSDRISDKLGKWHNLVPDDAIEPFNLDVNKLAARAKLLCQSEQYFYNNLSSYPESLILCYENMFTAQGGLEGDASAAVRALVDEDLRFPEKGIYHQNLISKASIISNYSEIVSAIERVARDYRDPAIARALQRG
ncbi:hypothetical protein FJ930_28645 [Mesorhizobium sp. B2-4-15]|uniref:hypothetical protein n=1 Tax=Mesorhizobium sp. B2-4-15 TaxID=2589934 RepID=UPI00114E5A8C|nr:hypothetical protein [Mesorhizobium sp. B2-4-15]TPK60448.1 hypothetical protein FJ930_28645 [Mesorhizobium sp. B2-4-15]